MSSGRGAAVVAAAVAVATAGCGLGPGESTEGEATLTVTRDYGAQPVLEASVTDPSESETVIRLLDREAEITTRFGGGFVQSIDGTAGEISDGRSSDWFFFVNGIESDRGGADVAVRGGDRIWWDYRDWTDAMRTPAVVGSWPEPFAQASAAEDERSAVALECMGDRGPCEEVSKVLAEEGIDADDNGSEGAPRILVGPWGRVREDPLAAQIDDGPATSGVFARFDRDGASWSLTSLDVEAEPAQELGPGAGLVAALRSGTDPPTWLVTGGDASGVESAIGLLDADDLGQRYAVAASDAGAVGLPDQGATP